MTSDILHLLLYRKDLRSHIPKNPCQMCDMFLDAFLDSFSHLLQASSVGQTAVFPKILMFLLF